GIDIKFESTDSTVSSKASEAEVFVISFSSSSVFKASRISATRASLCMLNLGHLITIWVKSAPSASQQISDKTHNPGD
ncbi:unnamed protein product, partial [Plutella xylostella]